LPFKGKDVYLFLEVSGKKRLDVELAERYADTSRSSWQKHIKAGHVAVNGTVQTSPKYEVTDVDVIAVSIPEKTDYSDHDFPIIYVDDEVVVIDKPAGVLTHSKGELNDEFTVADFFRRYTSYNLDTNRPGIIHRLDRDTSGVIIGARTEAAAQMLQKQFAERTVKKEYQAVVSGHPDPESAVIDLPIGRNPSAPSTFRVDPGGKTAQTTYETLQMGSGVTLVALRPKTGRTHQLRVHMQYIGTPIVGDKVYGTTPADRLYLHAHSLEVTIPGGERKVFTVPVPDSFEARVAE
jgi:23S rRNA pseudouridine1911/1915/1917 synthase